MSFFNSAERKTLTEARELRYALDKNFTYARDTLKARTQSRWKR